MLIHGDADVLVPLRQSTLLEAKLGKSGVPVKLVVVPGGVHGADFGVPAARADWPNYYAEMTAWLDTHLKAR
jgi:dipeptidyl aminopeptidase/acylaminoacyl peptidase